MEGRLEDVIQGNEILVLDTSIVDFNYGDSIHYALSKGFDGLDNLTQDVVGGQIERCRTIQDLAFTGRMVVLKEVYEEINADMNFLNKRISYLESNQKAPYYSEKINLIKEYAWEKSRLIKKLAKKELRLGFDNAPEYYLKVLNSIVAKQDGIFMNGLHHNFKQVMQRLAFERPELSCMREITENNFGGKHSVNFPMYSSFLSWSLFHNQRNKRELIERALTRRNPGCYGLFLDTDGKIISAALGLSYKGPVKILTRDSGLSRVLGAVSAEAKQKLGNRTPKQYSIELFFPAQPTGEVQVPREKAVIYN